MAKTGHGVRSPVNCRDGHMHWWPSKNGSCKAGCRACFSKSSFEGSENNVVHCYKIAPVSRPISLASLLSRRSRREQWATRGNANVPCTGSCRCTTKLPPGKLISGNPVLRRGREVRSSSSHRPHEKPPRVCESRQVSCHFFWMSQAVQFSQLGPTRSERQIAWSQESSGKTRWRSGLPDDQADASPAVGAICQRSSR